MAYAAVISLKRNLQRLKIPTSPLIKIYAYKELDSLKETLSRLDSSSNTSCNRTLIYSLDAEIREAVSKLEDMLESYTFHRSLPPSHIHGDQGSPQLQIPLVDENGVKEEIDSFMKTVKKLSEEYKKELENPSPIEEEDAAASSTDDSGGKNSTETVGLKDQFDEIIDGLMDLQSKHKIISLYGMAGIGKTHLAREVYRLPSIIQEFDLQIWVSISPQFRIKNVMADIAAQIDRRPRTEYINEDMKTLSERVRESLSGQRYFIVLDDIWSKAAWDALKRWFPIEQNGSRILLTTRLEEAATYPTTLSDAHQIRFLNNDESWNLLWQNVFVSSKSC